MPLLQRNYRPCGHGKLLRKLKMMVVVFVKLQSVRWSGKKEHITLTNCILPAGSTTGDLVPFWTIWLILLWQWIIECKENRRRVDVPTPCYSNLEDLLCLCMSLRFWACQWCTTQGPKRNVVDSSGPLWPIDLHDFFTRLRVQLKKAWVLSGFVYPP